MSRCLCCNKNLSDFESTRKNAVTGKYLDMCNTCFKESGIGEIISVSERHDLSSVDDLEEIEDE